MATIWTKADVGCYVDGANGESHAVERVYDLLEACGEEGAKLRDDMNGDGDDGYSIDEWLDDATDVLQEHTEDGFYWYWEAGDLFLCDELTFEAHCRFGS